VPKVLKWLGIAAGSIVVLLVILLGVVYALSSSRMNRSYSVVPGPYTIPTDSASLARGEHLVVIAKCADCHGDDMAGKVVVDDPNLGRVVGPNLTRGRGGIGGALSDADWARAIRGGVGRSGKPLPIMPAEAYTYLGAADLGQIVAYAKSRPPVDRELSPTHLKLLARVLLVTGQLPIYPAEYIDPAAPPPVAPAPDSTKEYGKYLADIGGCTGCHGPGLSGGHIKGTPPDWRPASNISPGGIGSWSESDFVLALREGKRRNGTAIDTLMPWKYTKVMTDAEIHALWQFVRSVPAKPFGGR